MALLTSITRPLGKASANAPTNGCQHHVEQRKHGHQRGTLPFGGATGAKQFYGGDKKRIVGQRRKELGRHDGEKTALHGLLFMALVKLMPSYIETVSSRPEVIACAQ
jgi:hypothetical protein